jgi:DNA-binding transcriptional regulator GbsR (MarR family)
MTVGTDLMQLTPVMQKFILHWGEMGTRWGVNRTVAQIHALLYLSPRPLNAEEISNTLSVARSNVSNSLRELQSWGLVKIVHVMGDRRDHFESLKDVWEMYRIVLDERKRRELDPTLTVLRECLADLEKGERGDTYTKERVEEITRFVEGVTGWYEEFRSLSKETVLKLMKLGSKVQKLLPGRS